jgi:alpha-amylase
MERERREKEEEARKTKNLLLKKKNFKNSPPGWLKFLRTSIGFDGWRFDYVKGYSGEFSRTYIDATVPDMAFGEYWVRRREGK